MMGSSSTPRTSSGIADVVGRVGAGAAAVAFAVSALVGRSGPAAGGGPPHPLTAIHAATIAITCQRAVFIIVNLRALK
jgi:hypothetical protein